MSPIQHHQQEHEENTDPFLELEPQTLYHHEHDNVHHSQGGHSHNHNTRERGHGHGIGHVNEDVIDPSLHEDRNSQGSGSRKTTNRLTDFASHILGSQDGDHLDLDHHDEHEHEHDHTHTHEAGHGHELSFTGEGGVLESSNHGFHVIDHDHNHELEDEVDEGEFEPHLEEGHEEDGEFVGETPGPQSQALPPSAAGTGRVARKRGAYGKRKRTGVEGDETVIKKQNHASLLPSLSSPVPSSHLLYVHVIPPPETLPHLSDTSISHHFSEGRTTG